MHFFCGQVSHKDLHTFEADGHSPRAATLSTVHGSGPHTASLQLTQLLLQGLVQLQKSLGKRASRVAGSLGPGCS